MTIEVVMVFITPAAGTRLQRLLADHPAEHVVRLFVTDLDHERIALSITLEDKAEEDDEIEEVEGLTIAIARNSVTRLEGVTLNYSASEGFTLQHPSPPARELRVISLN
jgi:Fe-S cluster assembly iron-binding protein IscA